MPPAAAAAAWAAATAAAAFSRLEPVAGIEPGTRGVHIFHQYSEVNIKNVII